jgi:hypothetical protein
VPTSPEYCSLSFEIIEGPADPLDWLNLNCRWLQPQHKIRLMTVSPK